MTLALSLFVGCDPEFTSQGDVVDAVGRPIPTAHVVLVCSGVDQDSVDTNSAGHFHLSSIGVFGKECAIEVRRAGDKAVSFDVLAHCSRLYRKELCAEVTLHATLPPKSAI
jgi:hypothetical protein